MDTILYEFKNNVEWLDNREHSCKTKTLFNIYYNILNNMEKLSLKIEKFENKPNYNYYIKKKNIKVKSKTIYEFLNLDKNTKLTKTEIIQHFHKYIKNNNLRDIEDSLKINFDEDLKHFFNLEDDYYLNYFNLQYHIFKNIERL